MLQMIRLCIFMLAFTSVYSLSGQTVSSFCHCDLTASFCDFDCCCDSDCQAAVALDCSNKKSKSYCPDPTFFSRIGSTYLTPNGCYYYNSTSTIVEEVAISTSQVIKLTNNNPDFTPISKSSATIYNGYLSGDVLTTGNNFLNGANCIITGAGTSTPQFSIKFGMNMQLRCQCLSCTTIPILFQIFGDNVINQYKGDSTKTLKIPQFTDNSLTNIQINIILGQFGSQKIKYIQRITSSSSTASSNQRVLSINFIQPSQIKPLSTSPSFFPQISQDMFYPIYLLS